MIWEERVCWKWCSKTVVWYTLADFWVDSCGIYRLFDDWRGVKEVMILSTILLNRGVGLSCVSSISIFFSLLA